MDLIKELLSPFDDLNIICEVHDIQCIGLCANYKCKEKIKFLCMKCVRTGQTCISKEKHELAPLSEILNRFFINKSNDLIEFQNIYEIIKDIDKDIISKIISHSKTIVIDNITKMNHIFFSLINYLNDIFKDKNKEYLNKLKIISIPKIENDKDINILLNIKMPEIDKKNSNISQNLLELVNKGSQLSSPQNFVNFLEFQK